MAEKNKTAIRKLHLKFAEDRGLESTYCPSEVARVFQPETWRDYMDAVRVVADELVEEGVLVTMQSGEIISDLPSKAKVPIRLRKT